MTKMMTVLIAMEQVRDRVLSLDEPITARHGKQDRRLAGLLERGGTFSLRIC